MAIQRFNVGPMDNNTYVVACEVTQKAAIVDPSLESESIWDWIVEHGLTLEYVVNTHGHFDHTYNNAYFIERSGAKLLIHALDVPLLEALAPKAAEFGLRARPSPAPDALLEDGQVFTVGELSFDVRFTPGHSPGHVVLYQPGAVIAGDTLFRESIGRTDLPGASFRELERSIKERLFTLPEETEVLPGHGPTTSIGHERVYNPFVGAAARLGLGGLWQR